MKRSAKILFFAVALFLIGSANNQLFPAGLKDDPRGTGCVNFLVINGASNVNKFSFSYVTPSLATGNKVKGADDERIDFEIPVHQFIPSNPRMYEDFLSLLNAEEYPYLRISLLTGNLYRVKNSGVSQSERLSVTIAGVTREYTVQCMLSPCGGSIVLTGMQTVRLTDFALSPPVKLGGIVRVDNELDVRFGFFVNLTD